MILSLVRLPLKLVIIAALSHALIATISFTQEKQVTELLNTALGSVETLQ